MPDTSTRPPKLPISGPGTWERNVGPMQANQAKKRRLAQARKAVATLRGLGLGVTLTPLSDDAPDVDAVLS